MQSGNIAYVAKFHCLIVEQFMHFVSVLYRGQRCLLTYRKPFRNKSIDSIDFEYSHEERMLSLFVKFSQKDKVRLYGLKFKAHTTVKLKDTVFQEHEGVKRLGTYSNFKYLVSGLDERKNKSLHIFILKREMFEELFPSLLISYNALLLYINLALYKYVVNDNLHNSRYDNLNKSIALPTILFTCKQCSGLLFHN